MRRYSHVSLLKKEYIAVDVRKEGLDILVIARTDVRADHGLEEAMERARAFSEIGADILFIEAPESVEEMQTICREVGRL
jgi:2-methylisocitrate lyase-like PEP mutase family enzyme